MIGLRFSRKQWLQARAQRPRPIAVLAGIGTAAAVLAAAIAWSSVRLDALPQAQAGRTARDGVFAADQAARGKVQFHNHCSTCHGEQLEGGLYNGDFVPALKRDDFMAIGDLDALFTRIRMRMPLDMPGSLPDATYVDVMAFLLEENGYPPGTEPLAPGKQGPIAFSRPITIRTGSLIQTVGCLARRGTDWVITNSSEPAATDRATVTAADVKSAEGQPLGAGTFRLMNPRGNLDTLVGHKVEVRGLLILARDDNRINVTLLQSVATTCTS